MQPYLAILLMLLLLLGPLVGTVVFALCLHLAIAPTSYIACGIFFVIFMFHLGVLAHLRYSSTPSLRQPNSDQNSMWHYFFHGPLIDVVGVILQLGTGGAGIYLSVLNKDNVSCDNHKHVESNMTSSMLDDSRSAADCDCATVLFLAALMVFTFRCYSLPFIVRLRMLTKKLRAQTIYADPRLRLASHELFNTPSTNQCRTGRAHTVGAPVYLLSTSSEFLPPPPTYEESQTEAEPPSYAALFASNFRAGRAQTMVI